MIKIYLTNETTILILSYTTLLMKPLSCSFGLLSDRLCELSNCVKIPRHIAEIGLTGG